MVLNATVPSPATARLAYVTGSVEEEIIISGTFGSSAVESGNYVLPVDLATETAGTAIELGGRRAPLAIAITPDGTSAYVVDTSGNQVVPIDVATNTAGTAIPVGSGAEGIAIMPDGSRAYVVNYGDDTVTRIDLATNTVSTTITGFDGPSGIAITPDGTRAYVTNYNDDTVSPIDLGSDTVGTAIPVGAAPWGIAITPDGSRLYVADSGDDTVTRIDLPAEAVGATISGPENPQLVAITPDGTGAYTIGGRKPVSPIDLNADTAGTGIGGGDFLGGLAIMPDGSRVYLTDHATDFLAQILRPANTLSQLIPVEEDPEAIAIVPNQPPHAVFTSSPAAAAPGESVVFDAKGSTDSDGTIARYDWDFGDGETAVDAGPNPSHVFTKAGTYQVTVTVTDNEGCSSAFVFTGQTAYCNGSSVAGVPHSITVTAPVVPPKCCEEKPKVVQPTPPAPSAPSCSAAVGSASSFVPKLRSSHVVPGVRVRLAVAAPAHLAIESTLVWSENGEVNSTGLENLSVDVNHWRRIRIPIPAPLRGKLPLGTKVGVKMQIQSTPSDGSGCTATDSQKKLRVRVVKVIPDAVQSQRPR